MTRVGTASMTSIGGNKVSERASEKSAKRLTRLRSAQAKKLLLEFKLEQKELRSKCNSEEEFRALKIKLELTENKTREKQLKKKQKDSELRKKLAKSFEVGKSTHLTLNEHRAKYIRATTPEASTRIARQPVDILNPQPVPSFLPLLNSANISDAPVQLYSPRSYDRPVRTPFIIPDIPRQVERVSTAEYKKSIDIKLGPEAALMWDTVNAAKKLYPKVYGGEVRGQTRGEMR